MKDDSTQGNMTTYLGPFERVYQIAFADILEAYDADGETLHRARFVALEKAEQFRGRARCQVQTLMQTRRVEGKRWGCVAEVFGPCPGVYAFTRDTRSTYVRIIRSKIEYPPDEEEKGWGSHTDFVEHKTRHLPMPSASRRQCVPLPLPVGYDTQLGHTHRAREVVVEEDDVGLVDFVQHVDVVSPLLFLRFVGSYRRRVGRGR